MSLTEFFENKTIMVFGGTGSIGTEIVTQLLKYNPKTIRIISNTENELWESRMQFYESRYKLRYFLGDIRNLERITRALKGVDYVFNAAAVKHVFISEYNPMEAINVNIHGLENIIEACLNNNVKKLIHISTDKAVNPTTVMGATKMLGERLLISRELAKGTQLTIISCVRFGNVLGSRGSLVPLIKEQLNNGNTVTLTDEKMRRFFLSISKAVELVLRAALNSQGGEIFVLKMPTILIKDLIEIIIEKYCPKIGKKAEDIKIEIIGSGRGEKLNEELISPIEFTSCYEIDDMYVVYPEIQFDYDPSEGEKNKNGERVCIDKEFHYSTDNDTPLTKEEIWEHIKDLDLL